MPGDEPPAGLSRGDWTDLQRQVAASSYQAARVAKPGPGPALRASNQRQRFAATFQSDGIELASEPSVAAPWRIGLSVTGYGYEGDVRPLERTEPRAGKERVEYRRGLLTEWYVNRPAGLEQGFELQDPGPGRGGPLVVALTVAGDLDVRPATAGASFVDRSGDVRVRYADLESWDADGHELRSRVEAADGQIRLVVDAGAARFPVTVDPTFVHEAQFTGHGDPSELNGTGFGSAVAIEGDTAVVGAYQTAGVAGSGVGAAYVFVKTNGAWTLQQKLLAADGSAGDQFGTSISLSGETVVVGSPYEDDDVGGVNDKGAAYVFVRSGSTWTQQQKLEASDAAAGDQFAWRVSISGDTVAAGAPFRDAAGQGDSGSGYVFVRSGTVWTQQQILTASDGAPGNQLGSGVSVSADTVVLGAPLGEGAAGDAGAAYVYVRAGTTWSEQQKLTASDGATGDDFGAAAAVTADTVVVGAPGDTIGGQIGAGSAYVYVRAGTTWSEQQKLTASDGTTSDEFGSAVSVSFDTAVVGAPTDNTYVGAAYVYVRSGTTWSEQQKLVSGGTGVEIFGIAVSVFGDEALVGADAGGAGLGAAHLFVRGGSTWFLQAYLLPPYVTADDRFGRTVSISGDTVLVGAPLDDRPGGANLGSAYAFARSGGFWAEQQFLHPSDGATDDNFGAAVAVDGDTAVVGSPLHDSPAGADAGAVYVFVRAGTAWTEQQKLAASDAAAANSFGSSVSISGDTIVVGAPRADTGGGVDAGAAYVFLRSGITWTEQQKLVASDGTAGDLFGSFVSIDGDTAVIGAPGDDPVANNEGSAYAFVRSGSTWTQQQKLIAPDASAQDLFGAAVSIAGNTTVIGAPAADGVSASAGAAYVFLRSGAVWSFQQKLAASDGLTDDEFGIGVSLSADTALVGARKGDGAVPDTGASYVYVRSGVSWSEQQKLLAPDGAADDAFGTAVSVDGDQAAVGAPLDDTVGGPDSGTVHMFLRISIADLAVTKTDGQATAAPGEQITYTIVVSNAGPEAVTGAAVSDTVPAALQAVTWTCSASPGSSCTPSGAGNINDAANLLVGGTATYLLTGTVDIAATGTLTNTATVAPPIGGFDPNTGDNTATDSDPIVPQADVAVSKTDTPDPVQPGGALTYTVTVSNLGPSTATGVTLTDTLPTGVTFLSSVPGPPTCVFSGATLACNLGTLAGGANSVVTINTTVTATGGILVNTASASAAEADPETANNSGSASTGVGVKDGELRHGFEETFDLAALPGPVADEDVFRISQKPYSSYEIVVDAASGDIGAGSGPALERLGPDGTTVLQSSLPTGTGPARSLRWINATASVVEGETIRVRSLGCTTNCGPDDTYRIRVYDTTYAVPRFNNSGTQVTVLVLQNPTDYTISGEAYFRDTAGALVGTQAFSLGPKAALVLNTSTVPGVAGASGAITVANDGRYGDLFGKTVALEPATGFSFDSALDVRPK
jgi:uncharacterized repeat protein (TIGR01451 family)